MVNTLKKTHIFLPEMDSVLPVIVVVFVGTGILSFVIGSAFNMQNILWGMFHVRLPG